MIRQAANAIVMIMSIFLLLSVFKFRFASFFIMALVIFKRPCQSFIIRFRFMKSKLLNFFLSFF